MRLLQAAICPVSKGFPMGPAGPPPLSCRAWGLPQVSSDPTHDPHMLYSLICPDTSEMFILERNRVY